MEFTKLLLVFCLVVAVSALTSTVEKEVEKKTRHGGPGEVEKKTRHGGDGKRHEEVEEKTQRRGEVEEKRRGDGKRLGEVEEKKRR